MKSRVGAFLLGLCLIAPIVSAQREAVSEYKDLPFLPEGPLGARIRSFIEVMNSGNPNLIRPFLEREFTAEHLRSDIAVDHLVYYQRESGGCDFFGIRSYNPPRPAEIEVVLKSRILGDWHSYTFTIGPSPEYHFLTWLGRTIDPPAGVHAPALTEKEAIEEIRRLCDGLIARDWLSGAVLVANRTDVLLTAAGGEADRAFHVPNRVDTKFYLGRINRMFTATAVARLVEAGKISFDDPISQHIDETWLAKTLADKITVRHLMAQTSGLKQIPNGSTERKPDGDFFRRIGDFKPLVKKVESAAAPGVRNLGSNTDWFLLGAIIEKVTGEDYYDHMRKTIFLPSGMMNTDCYEMDDPVENRAVPYRYEWTLSPAWRSDLFLYPPKGGPAGGGYSTVEDLHKFALALLAGKLLARPMLEILWTASPESNRGLGFEVSQELSQKSVGYNGMISCLYFYPDSGYIIALTSNDKDSFHLAKRIGQTLARVKPR